MEQSEDEKDEVQPEGETYDFSRPHYQFNPGEHHEWRQQGPYIVCHSCELIHAEFIGMGKWLVGLDDQGRPLFKNKE